VVFQSPNPNPYTQKKNQSKRPNPQSSKDFHFHIISLFSSLIFEKQISMFNILYNFLVLVARGLSKLSLKHKENKQQVLMYSKWN